MAEDARRPGRLRCVCGRRPEKKTHSPTKNRHVRARPLEFFGGFGGFGFISSIRNFWNSQKFGSGIEDETKKIEGGSVVVVWWSVGKRGGGPRERMKTHPLIPCEKC